MDRDAFFDRLYSRFHVHFPCFALLREEGGEFVAEPASDGSASVVILTDDDLLARYRDEQDEYLLPVTLADANDLRRFLGRLPAAVTHVTFDPSDWFHRRYPAGLIRKLAARAARLR